MRLTRVPSAVAVVAGLLGGAAPTLRAQDSAPARPRPTAPSSQAVAASASRAHPAVVKHTVKAGDTLWDIARFYLKDPFKWPQVFHANTDIVKNPHWIYPGQVLTIEGSAVKDDVAAQVNDEGFVVSTIQTRAQQNTVFTQQTQPSATMSSGTIDKAIALTVRPGEYDAAPYLVDAEHPIGAGRLLGAVETLALGLHSDAGFQFNDRLYVTPPAGSSFKVGDRVIVARAPETIPDVGRVIEPTGIVRIDSVNASGPAIGTLIKQYGPVVRDQVVLPIGRSFETTTVRPVVGSYPLSTKVLWIQGDPKLPSLQTYVILDAGATKAAGVAAGDQFTLFDNAPAAASANTPPVATGLVKVVRVTPFGATGIIVDQAEPQIREGMAARLTAKMP